MQRIFRYMLFCKINSKTKLDAPEKPLRIEVKLLVLIFSLLIFCSHSILSAQKIGQDLTELSLEDLLNIKVTLPSRKAEKYYRTPAAIFLITPEDIQRFGFTCVSEVLRMVPGMEVARIDANKWAISCRGFNNRFANKLLILIDGQSVYTSMFSGVFWEARDVFLEDVSRIEVIRGPGATIWGANAVNGVVNIITKKAEQTTGGLLNIGVGTEEKGFLNFRHGTKLGENVFFRFYNKYHSRDAFIYQNNKKATDEWWINRNGFRLDWDADARNFFSLLGNYYYGKISQTYNIVTQLKPPYKKRFDHRTEISGASLLTYWDHLFSPSSALSIQFFYNWLKRDDAIVRGNTHTFDLDIHHHFTLGEQQEFVWGVGYRHMSDHVPGTLTFELVPDKSQRYLFSSFIQDDIYLINKYLRMTLGSKFEKNSHTGFEYQPNIRLLWMPHTKHTFWMAVSRAVRTPSRAEDDVKGILTFHDFGEMFSLGIVYGTREFKSETLIAHEFGYRVYPFAPVMIDLTAFYNKYDKLRTIETGLTMFGKYVEEPPPPHIEYPIYLGNTMKGLTYGFEMSIDYRFINWWHVKTNYSYLNLDLSFYETSTDQFSWVTETASPAHQVSIWNKMDLPGNCKLAIAARYVDSLEGLNVPEYYNLDINFSVPLSNKMTLSIVGQNLINSSHKEYTTPSGVDLPTDSYTAYTKVQRGFFGALKWAF